MKLLTTRNGSYLTGTEIADAVMHYGLALTRRHDVDFVNLPFLDDLGVIRRVELTVGWQNDTIAISDAQNTDELLEVHTVAGIYAKTQQLSVLQAEPFTEEERSQMQWPAFDQELT